MIVYSGTASAEQGVVALFAYPLVGALAVAICSVLASVSDPGFHGWDKPGRILRIAVWPVTLAAHLITFIPKVLVHRIL